MLPFASQYTDQVKKFFAYCENLLKEGESTVKGYEDNVQSTINSAEQNVSGLTKDVKEGINETERGIDLAQRNVAAISSYGSTSK